MSCSSDGSGDVDMDEQRARRLERMRRKQLLGGNEGGTTEAKRSIEDLPSLQKSSDDQGGGSGLLMSAPIYAGGTAPKQVRACIINIYIYIYIYTYV